MQHRDDCKTYKRKYSSSVLLSCSAIQVVVNDNFNNAYVKKNYWHLFSPEYFASKQLPRKLRPPGTGPKYGAPLWWLTRMYHSHSWRKENSPYSHMGGDADYFFARHWSVAFQSNIKMQSFEVEDEQTLVERLPGFFCQCDSLSRITALIVLYRAGLLTGKKWKFVFMKLAPDIALKLPKNLKLHSTWYTKAKKACIMPGLLKLHSIKNYGRKNDIVLRIKIIPKLR